MSFQYTKTQHTTPYPSISPTLPSLASPPTRSVLIVGGSTGIGKATALAFLASGSRRIALLARRQPVLDATAAALRAQYPDARVVACAADVADEHAVDAAFAKARRELGAAPGGLDVVVNAAGVAPPLKTLAQSDVGGAWWRGFETNVRGAAVVARAAAKHAVAADNGDGDGDGAVLLYLGTAGALFPANAAFPASGYAASKLAGVKVMEYFGAENPGVRVISVHPGVVTETEGGKKMVEESGMEWPGDDINLPAHFLVWAASKEAEFLKNKFVFAAWDVDELKARKDEIAQSPELIIGLNGLPRNV
ncbi:putative short-chain dehydrogenase [Daldinia caldariorum]|uniref:putative short-chain dehydrogenase n=1 Tax=Daldinia caldariorum TaxID=326644 RepID=UPI002008792F|nr:putative short-chain dehydrogenase [Daldinia caldariorum]KAI1466771.1 putative short-chain dehydrogenase [Daldinia caldariorum]